jgi:hypothetical protein
VSAGSMGMDYKPTTDESINALWRNISRLDDWIEKVENKSEPRYHMVAPDGKQWKDLDIDNLPSKFFTRDDIEIEGFYGGNEWCDFGRAKNCRIEIIPCVINSGGKYRYRLKEDTNKIKVGDWVRHNYCNTPTIEIFKVGRIDADELYNYDESIITQNSNYVYLENCTKLTPEQMVSIDVWNERI